MPFKSLEVTNKLMDEVMVVNKGGLYEGIYFQLFV